MLTLRLKHQGFTIVELLIVIVVLAVLAAISFVAYSSIQARATNTAIISAAKNTLTLVKAYKAEKGNYPSLGGFCATIDNRCTSYNNTVITSDNTYWMSELRKIGSPVQAIELFDTTRYGLYLDLYAPRTYNHQPIPGLLMYHLKGHAQNCGLPDVVRADPSPLPGEANAYLTSHTPYTYTDSTVTTCWVSV